MRGMKVLIVPLLAAALASTGCDLMTANLRAEQTAQWQKSYPIAASGSVDIENVNGKIEVEPSSGNTVEVTAMKKARGASDEAAKAALDRITIVEDVSGDHVRIEAKFPNSSGMFNGNPGSVEFHVKVPAGLNAKFATVNGEVNLRGLSGRVNAETTNGGVTTHDITGQLEASTTNGGLDIDFAKVAEGGAKLECVNGGITVHVPRDAKATIAASITNGGIDTKDLPIERSSDENSRRKLDAKMNGGGPRLEIAGTNGGITLTSR